MVRRIIVYSICLFASLGVVGWLVTVLDNTLPDRWALGVALVAGPIALVSTWALSWFIVAPIFFGKAKVVSADVDPMNEKKMATAKQHLEESRDNKG